MLTLAGFQEDFVQALRAPEQAQTSSLQALCAQPGFAVYRNTVMKAGIDTLQANYPSVVRLVGEPWFRAAAAVYVASCLPDDPCLLHYGQGFADFLAGFEPAAALPYLPHVARLDRLRTECHVAADALPLAPDGLARLAPEQLAACTLRPHPAARWIWFEETPAFSIWRANNESGIDLQAVTWQPEGCLLTRPLDAVHWSALDAAGIAFLESCAAGGTLADAANRALASSPHADLAQLLAALLAAGAFAEVPPGNI